MNCVVACRVFMAYFQLVCLREVEKQRPNRLCLLHTMALRKQIKGKRHRKRFSVPQMYLSGSLHIHEPGSREAGLHQPPRMKVLGVTHPEQARLAYRICLLVDSWTFLRWGPSFHGIQYSSSILPRSVGFIHDNWMPFGRQDSHMPLILDVLIHTQWQAFLAYGWGGVPKVPFGLAPLCL